MTTGQKLIAGALIALAGAEVYGIKHPGSSDTISEITRTVLHTDTQIGRVAFMTLWGAFASWYAVHIITGSKSKK
jgi:hypothetical protein